MSLRKFVAPSAREALAMVRKTIGADAVILSNRKTAEGVAVIAVSEHFLPSMNSGPLEEIQCEEEVLAPEIDSARRHAQLDPTPAPAVDPETMSTVNFERFSHERRARIQQPVAEVLESNPHTGTKMTLTRGDPDTNARPAAAQGVTAPELLPSMQSMAEELRQMRGFIRQQFSALAWVDGVRRTPAQARLLKIMIESGFSSKLARVLVGRLPEDTSEENADKWLHDALVRNLRTASFENGALQRGGVFALVGPTGVGKTTSAAKIAAQYAMTHGPESVGLISADAYRIAGREQLERYGRMIGTPVLKARNGEELGELLIRLEDRSLVLIDTAGLGQRDPRVAELLEVLEQGPVQRLVVASASAQAEAIDETLNAYRADESAGVILTKIDEACRLGGALDTLIRHRLPLHAVGNGQRVPEDWAAANAETLIADALEHEEFEGTQMPDIDLTMLMQRIEPVSDTLSADLADVIPPVSERSHSKSFTHGSMPNV